MECFFVLKKIKINICLFACLFVCLCLFLFIYLFHYFIISLLLFFKFYLFIYHFIISLFISLFHYFIIYLKTGCFIGGGEGCVVVFLWVFFFCNALNTFLLTVMWCWTEILREETGHHQFMASLTKYLFISITSCLPSSMENKDRGST